MKLTAVSEIDNTANLMITGASGSTALRSPPMTPTPSGPPRRATPPPLIKEFVSISGPPQDTNSLINGPQARGSERGKGSPPQPNEGRTIMRLTAESEINNTANLMITGAGGR